MKSTSPKSRVKPATKKNPASQPDEVIDALKKRIEELEKQVKELIPIPDPLEELRKKMPPLPIPPSPPPWTLPRDYPWPVPQWPTYPPMPPWEPVWCRPSTIIC